MTAGYGTKVYIAGALAVLCIVYALWMCVIVNFTSLCNW